MSSKSKRTELTVRVIFFVTLFFAIIVSLIVFLMYSESFVGFIGKEIPVILAKSGKTISINGLKGSIIKGLSFDSLDYSEINKKILVKINKGQVNFNFDCILTQGIVNLDVKSKDLFASGFILANNKLDSIPIYKQPVCFANIPATFEIDNMSIDTVKLAINGVKDSYIFFNNINISNTENYALKKLSCGLDLIWKNSSLGIATISGDLNQRQNKFNGKSDWNIANQYINTELNVISKKGKLELNGYISESRFNIDTISDWLSEIWQKYAPISLKGNITCKGSWLYNPSVGLMGNLTGMCNKIQIVVNGFNIQLAEISNTWNLLNGNLTIEDKGSFVFHTPATINGKIESVAYNDRKWNLNVEANDLNVSSFTSMIPLPFKYALGLPDLTGKADLTFSAIGKEPNNTIRITSNELYSIKNDSQCKITGYLAWIFSDSFNNLEGNICINKFKGNPEFFSRLLGKQMNKYSPLSFEYKLHGDPTAEIKLNGRFISGIGRNEHFWGKVGGEFKKNKGEMVVSIDESSPFSDAINISLNELLLAK